MSFPTEEEINAEVARWSARIEPLWQHPRFRAKVVAELLTQPPKDEPPPDALCQAVAITRVGLDALQQAGVLVFAEKAWQRIMLTDKVGCMLVPIDVRTLRRGTNGGWMQVIDGQVTNIWSDDEILFEAVP